MSPIESTPQPRHAMLVFRRSVRASVVVATLRGIHRMPPKADGCAAAGPSRNWKPCSTICTETRSGDKTALDIAADGSVNIFYNGACRRARCPVCTSARRC